MTVIVTDTFTGADGTLLSAHVGEVGATWTKHPNSAAGDFTISSNEIYASPTPGCLYYASGVPGSADYYVQGVFHVLSVTAQLGIAGRLSTSANTYYNIRYNATQWELRKLVAGTATTLGTFSQTLTVGNSYSVRLTMSGTSINCSIDGVSRISVTDSAISAAGRAGVFSNTGVTTTTGLHMDQIIASDSTAAVAYTLTGPSTCIVGEASSNFTVQLDGGTTSGDVTVTPSDSGAGGTFTPSTVTLNTTTQLATFTYTAASTGVKSISTTNNGGLTDPSPVSTTASAITSIFVNNPNVVWSQYGWLISGSSFAKINNNQNSVKLGFTGTSIKVAVDVSNLVAGSVSSGDYPQIKYVIDGGDLQTVTLTSSSATVTLATGLAAGNHRIRLWDYARSNSYDNWNTPVYSYKITRFILDDGASSVYPFDECTPFTKRMLFFGDSITNGLLINPVTHWCHSTANAMQFEMSVVGWGGQGWTAGGTGNVPTFPNAWNFMWSGQARSFSPEPDFVCVAQGTNDFGSSAATIATAVQNWITSFRGSCPNAVLFICLPLGQFATGIQTNVIPGITNGVNAYKAANPSDLKVYLVNPGENNSYGLNRDVSPTWLSTDGTHPNDVGSAWITALMTASLIYAQPPAIQISNCSMSNVNIL